MYDNLDFKLNINEVKEIDFLSETPHYFDVTGQHYFNGANVITGNLKGFRISVSERGVNLKDGSLCKYYLGDNFQTLGRGDTKQAIEMLSDTLHLPLHKATVTRIDIAQNYIVKHPTSVYFNHLGNCMFNERLVQPDGLYYKNSSGLLVFYDKVKEQKAKGQIIPELYNNRNTLRYEMRHKVRIKNTFKVERVTAEMLYNETFYRNIIDQWHKAYKDIQKINDVSLNFEIMRGKKDLYLMGLVSLIDQQGGEIEILKQINEAFKKGNMSRKNKHDLINAIKEAGKATIATIQSDVIQELDKKINESVKNYR